MSDWTAVTMDSQVLSAFMGCPREMDFRFNRHLVPISAKSHYLQKGTLAHKGLETFYSLMKPDLNYDWSYRNAEALKAMRTLAPTLDLDSEHILDVYRTFEEYSDFRKGDVFQVIFTEHLFKIKIFEAFPLRIYLTGRIDLGVMEGDTLIPIDHKTESESWFYTQNSNQFKIYALACGSQKLIVNRFGFQKTVKPEKKFKREELFFEKDVLEEFKHEIIPYYAKQMIIAAEDKFYPPNYSNCVKGHFGCIFSDKYNGGVCNISRELRDQKLGMHFKVREWNIHQDEA